MSSQDSEGGSPSGDTHSEHDNTKNEENKPAPGGSSGSPAAKNPPPRKSAWDHKYLKWLPIPDLQRILPFTNMELYQTKDPWLDIKEMGACSMWVASIFGLGTFLGQMRSGLPIRELIRRVYLGAGIGVFGIVGGCMIRDITIKIVWEHQMLCENLRNARITQLHRRNYGDPAEMNRSGAKPLNENSASKPQVNLGPNNLEEHETIGPVTHTILAGLRILLFCVQVKILSASTRFIAAGIYPYFLGRWMTKSDPHLSYMFAASMMRRSREYYWVYAGPLFFLTLGSYKPKEHDHSLLFDYMRSCRWLLLLFGIVLIWRYNKAARRFLSLDRKEYTVKSSAQYFLDSTRK